MAKGNPKGHGTFYKKFSAYRKYVRNGIDGIAPGNLLWSRVNKVVKHKDYPAYEKDSAENRISKLKRGVVPREFEWVRTIKPGTRAATAIKTHELEAQGVVLVTILEPSVKIIGKQHLYNGDCLKVLKNLAEKSIDVVVTSPPYNIGVKYGRYEDNLRHHDYLSWIREVGEQLHKVVKDDGSFFLNIGGINSKPLIPMEICLELTKNGLFVLQNDITWIKSISIFDQEYVDKKKVGRNKFESDEEEIAHLKDVLKGDAQFRTFGHFKPINSARFLNHQHEKIFHFTKTGDVPIDRLAIGVPYGHKSNINRWKHDEKKGKLDLRCRGNTWHIPYKTVQRTKEHPAGYPVDLVEKCIKLHGYSSDMVVLDPFLGAGTTLVACERLEVNGVGIELDESYCFISENRLISLENIDV